MHQKSFSAMVRGLARDYYLHKMAFDEYRTQRRQILDAVDRHFNGKALNNSLEVSNDDMAGDFTQPYNIGDTGRFAAVELKRDLRRD